MLNGEDYYTRKGDYAIKGLVICDDAVKITWIKVGWLGSVHDNRVWSNSEIYLGRDEYFDHKENFLGDSAFSTSAVTIPAFKKGHNSSLSEEKQFFNTKLAKVRIKSEHCIGLLKAFCNYLSTCPSTTRVHPSRSGTVARQVAWHQDPTEQKHSQCSAF